MSTPSSEQWVTVYESGTDFDADIVRDRLGSADIPAVVLTQRDHAFNFTVGDMARVKVCVPPDRLADAEALLADLSFTDEELAQASADADPFAEDAYTEEMEASLDSGNEQISFDVPDEPRDA